LSQHVVHLSSVPTQGIDPDLPDVFPYVAASQGKDLQRASVLDAQIPDGPLNFRIEKGDQGMLFREDEFNE